MKRETRVRTETNKWCCFAIFICPYLFAIAQYKWIQSEISVLRTAHSCIEMNNSKWMYVFNLPKLKFFREKQSKKKKKTSNWNETIWSKQTGIALSKMTQCHSLWVYCCWRSYLVLVIIIYFNSSCCCCYYQMTKNVWLGRVSDFQLTQWMFLSMNVIERKNPLNESFQFRYLKRKFVSLGIQFNFCIR